MKLVAASFAILLSAGLLSKAACADTVSLTLNNSNQVPIAGSTLVYTGTVSARSSNSGAVYLNGDAYTLGGSYGFTDVFLTTFPLSLGPGASFTGVVFDIAVPLSSPIAPLAGSFSILGGATANSYNVLSTASFGSTVTPEPSTWVLLVTGVLGSAVVVRRRRFRLESLLSSGV